MKFKSIRKSVALIMLGSALLFSACGSSSSNTENNGEHSANSSSADSSIVNDTQNDNGSISSDAQSDNSTDGNNSATSATDDVENNSSDLAVGSSDDTEVGTISLKITVRNRCKADFGMFSVINPSTQDQAEIGAIESGKELVITMDWPTDVTTFYWAIYNQAGELYMQGETDLTGATESVLLSFVGEDSVKDFVADVK